MHSHYTISKLYSSAPAIFFALIIILSLTIGTAPAASGLFKVEKVKVDVTADNALLARDQAFEEAQRKAFVTVAQRMLPAADFEFFMPPDTATISSLIKDFEIENEKLSSVRYIASYTFRFKDREVKNYFSNSGADFTDVASRPILILPFYNMRGQQSLWSPYNIFMQAWARSESENTLVPTIVPLGDLQDIRLIADNEALNYQQGNLEAMLKRYDAGEAVIVIAQPDENLSLVSRADDFATGSLTIATYRTDRRGPELVQQYVLVPQEGQTRAQFFDIVVQDIQTKLRKDWKNKTVVSAGQSNVLQVRVRFNSLNQWIKTKEALSGVIGINEMQVQSISPRQAFVDLFYQGDERRLRLALQQADITLSQPRVSPAVYDRRLGHNNALIYDVYLSRYASQFSAPYAPY